MAKRPDDRKWIEVWTIRAVWLVLILILASVLAVAVALYMRPI